ncbi:MAG TPA: DMT family transporter [bacterium]|nr:DMT family transporter [bacterium]
MAANGTTWLPHLALTLLIAIWAGSFVVAKVAMATVSPFALVASRFLIGTLCILPLFLRTSTARRRGTLGPGLLAGAVLAVPYFLQMYGVRETTASMGGFVTGLIVLLVALGGHFFFGARIGPKTLLGLALGLSGIVVLCLTGDDTNDPQQHNTVRGILLQVGAAIGFAAHILLLSHFGRKLAVAPFTFWQLAFTGAISTAATLLISGIAADGSSGIAVTTELLLAFFYLGVLATGVAIAVQANVQHRIPPTHVALLFALQPLFAALAGFLCQGDRLSAGQWAGGGLIVVGVIAAARDR